VLIRPGDDGALAIGQLSHSWLAGQLARAWGNERFGGVDPREEVVLGAEQHDIGWALFDLEPRFNPDTGLPRSFLELTVDDHLAIWRDAPDHLLTQSLHAALVVSMHGSSLSELRAAARPADAERVRDHIDAEHARQRALRERLGVSEAKAERTRPVAVRGRPARGAVRGPAPGLALRGRAGDARGLCRRAGRDGAVRAGARVSCGLACRSRRTARRRRGPRATHGRAECRLSQPQADKFDTRG
jgi:hypothetical protein